MNWIKNYFKNRKERKDRVKKQAEKVIESYQDLIAEYHLIQEKKSKLSRSQRDFVEYRIKHLILKGHIQIKD